MDCVLIGNNIHAKCQYVKHKAPQFQTKPTQNDRREFTVQSIYFCPPPKWNNVLANLFENRMKQPVIIHGRYVTVRYNRWGYKFYNFLMTPAEICVIYIFH
jgi:hypothetical protein